MLQMRFFWCLLLSTGCFINFFGCDVDYASGDVGLPRYFGEFLQDPTNPSGLPPITERILPPVRDRDGNTYIATRRYEYGTCAKRDTDVVVNHIQFGIWRTAENIREDKRITHGWVGFAKSKSWLWAGDKLISIANGGWGKVLDVDPSTGANLEFLGVIPWVWDQPSRQTILALITSPSDPTPFHALIDLGRKIYTDLRLFNPIPDVEPDPTKHSVLVLGTGGNLETRTGVMLVKYLVQKKTMVEAIYLDQANNETARVSISGLETATEDDIRGFLSMDTHDTAAGVLTDGRVVIITRENATVQAISSMTPMGVHIWENELWLVGKNQGQPVIAPIKDATIGASETWQASINATQELQTTLDVLDERNSPKRMVTWGDTANAIGDYAFLTPYSLIPYSHNRTGWLMTGPSYTRSSGEQCLSTAFLPISVSYP